jgi:putative aldouronate transport system substrate-binding protein
MFTGCKKEATKSVKGDGKVTVGIAQNATIPDYKTNAFTRYLEDVTGLEIEYVHFASGTGSYAQQVTLMCAGGEQLPDVFVGLSFGHYMVNQFGEDGYFIDLSELIETNAPNYQKAMEGLPKKDQAFIKQKMTNTVDGKSVYAMPSYAIECIDDMQSMMYINQKWLDAVGMQAPTNTKELEAVCQAFLTKDPNGNGKADEMPMLAQEGIRNYIINAFCEYDAGTFNVDAEGKVWDPVYTDEFRQGVKYIYDMVQKEYINELGFTLSTQEIKNLISPTDGTAEKVGIFSGHHESMTNASTDILDDFVALAPLNDETGKGGYNIIADTFVDFKGITTADCADPEEAMLFLDAFYTDEAVTRQRHGEKDVDWYYEEGKNAYGTDSYARVINSQAFFDGTMNCTMGNMLGIMSHWNYLLVKETEETTTDNRAIQAARLQTEAWDIHENKGKQQAGVVDQLVYTTEEYDEREAKAGSMDAYLGEQLVLFMQGEKNPHNDADWNEFTKTLTLTVPFSSGSII